MLSKLKLTKNSTINKDEFIIAYALSQREFPQGIGWSKSFKIKQHIYSKYSLASETFLYDAPDSVCAEILKELRNESDSISCY